MTSIQKEVFRVSSIAFKKDCRIMNDYSRLVISGVLKIGHIELLVRRVMFQEQVTRHKEIYKIGLPWSSIN